MVNYIVISSSTSFSSYFPKIRLIKAFVNSRASDIQLCRINIQAVCQIRSVRTQNIDVCRRNVIADCWAGTSECSNLWLVLLGRMTVEVVEFDVRDRQRGRVEEAEGQIALTVALINLNCVVNSVNEHGIVSDVVHSAVATASLQIA